MLQFWNVMQKQNSDIQDEKKSIKPGPSEWIASGHRYGC
jgi:hypothetical protein